MPNVVSLFEDMFHQPQTGDKILPLSPTEILERIRNQKKVNVVTQTNATVLGTYLHRKDYKKQRRQYLVTLN